MMYNVIPLTLKVIYWIIVVYIHLWIPYPGHITQLYPCLQAINISFYQTGTSLLFTPLPSTPFISPLPQIVKGW